MNQFRIRPLRWKNPDGTVDIPRGRTVLIGDWAEVPAHLRGQVMDGIYARVYPAVMEYRNPITGPTLWTAVDVVAEDAPS